MGRNAGRLVCSLLAGALLLAATGRCIAGQVGHYSAGLPNAHDYFIPPAGTYYVQYNYWYQTDTFRNRDGRSIDTVTVPSRGTFKVDVDLDLFVLAPGLMYSPDIEFLGARWGAYMVQPIANPSLEAAITGVELGRRFEQDTWGAGDTFVQPVWAQWSLAPVEVSLGYGFYAPSGRFNPGATDNIGLGYWTQQLQNAAQLWLDPARTISLIAAQTWEFNDRVEDSDLRPGSRVSVNWGLGKSFHEGLFEAVVLGYDVFQVAKDSGSDQPPLGRGAKDQVHAVGLQLGSPKYGLSVKYLREFGAEDRFEGNVVTITFGLPLDPLFDQVRSLAN